MEGDKEIYIYIYYPRGECHKWTVLYSINNHVSDEKIVRWTVLKMKLRDLTRTLGITRFENKIVSRIDGETLVGEDDVLTVICIAELSGWQQ